MQAGSSLPSFWMRNKLPKEYNKHGIKNNEVLKWSLLSCSWWITFSLHLELGWEYPGASLTLPMTKRLQGLASTPCPVQWRISLKNTTTKRKSRSYFSFKICVGRVWGDTNLQTYLQASQALPRGLCWASWISKPLHWCMLQFHKRSLPELNALGPWTKSPATACRFFYAWALVPEAHGSEEWRSFVEVSS